MPGRTLLILLGMAVPGLLGAACGERSEPVGELAQAYPVRVQGAGERATILTAAPQRIVAFDAGPAEIAAALGRGAQLVGVPAGVEIEDGGRREEVVRPSGQLSVDAAIALEPDLILATEETDPVDVARAARDSGAALYVQPSSSIEDVERGILELGFLLGRAAEARRLTAGIQRKVDEIKGRLEGVKPASVFVDTGFFLTVPGRSLLGDLIRTAKGLNIAGPTPGPDPLPPARIARRDPDIYAILDNSRLSRSGLRRDPDAAKIRAVRKGRIAVLPAALVNRAGPRIGDGLEAMARALHPDAFR